MGEAIITRRGGGYNVGDELLPDKYTKSLLNTWYIRNDFDFIGMDNSNIYLFEIAHNISDGEYLYRISLSNFTTRHTTNVFYGSKFMLSTNYLHFFGTGSYGFYNEYNKSDLSLNYSDNPVSYGQRGKDMELGSGNVSVVVGWHDYDEYAENYDFYIDYKYSGKWKFCPLERFGSNYDFCVCASGSYAFGFIKRYGDTKFYKVDGYDNSTVLTKSLSYEISDATVLSGYIFAFTASSVLKFDLNGNLVSSIARACTLLYNDGSYLYCKESTNKIIRLDSNLNVNWERTLNNMLIGACRSGSNFAILERVSGNSKISLFNTGTNIPEEKITIIA